MEYALTILSRVGVMFMLMAVGFGMYKSGIMSEEGRAQLSKIVLKLVCPVLIFMAYQTEATPELLSGLFWSFLLSLISVAAGVAISYFAVGKNRANAAISRFSIAYSNCAFIGIPLVSGIFGNEGVFYVTSYITMFNIFVWSLGVMQIKGEKSAADFLKSLLSPTILAVVLGLVFFAFGIMLPPVPAEALNYISSLNTPLAMFIAGATVADSDMARSVRNPSVLWSCFCKLIVLPVIIMFVFKLIPVPSEVVFITIVIATACPTATIGTLFALEYGKNAVYASEIFALSTLLSGITMPIMVVLSQYVFAL